MKRRSKERRKRILSSARETAMMNQRAERTSLAIPKDAELFNPKKPGVYRIDIIPYEVSGKNPHAKPGVLHFERTYWAHRGVGPDNNTYICPYMTFKKPCPICEHVSKLQRVPDYDKELVGKIRAKQRQLFNVIDHADKDAGVKIWDVSHFLFGQFLDEKVKNADEEDAEAYEKFHDPENGLTLKLGVKEQKGAGFTWYEAGDIEFKARKTQYDDSIIDEAYDLDSLVKEIKYDELKKIFMDGTPNGEVDEDEDDEEDEPKAKKKHHRDEEEDDDEEDVVDDEEDDEEDDDEDEAPRKKKKVRFKIGMEVEHRKFGDCEIVHISSDGTSLRLEDEKGDIHKGVDANTVTIIEGDEDEDEEEERPKKKKKPVKKSRDEEEDEDDSPFDDEEDEDEAPRRKKKRRVEEEDEDDEDDE